MHFPHISVIHILKAMGLRNTLVIQHLCHGLKYRLKEFFLRSGLKLDLDLTPSHITMHCAMLNTKFSISCYNMAKTPTEYAIPIKEYSGQNYKQR